MNLRCAFCQTPYTLGRVEKISALQHMDAEKLTHYDAHCPRCRRATPIPRQRLEMTLPNWREALKELEVEMTAHPQHEAPLPKPEPFDQTQDKPVAVPQTESKPKPTPAKAEKKASAKSAPKAKTAEKKITTVKKATKKSK